MAIKSQVTNEQRKVSNRSGTIVCDICSSPEILVQHHLNGRLVTGWNEPWNTCDCCDNCHRKIHNGVIILEGWFKTTNGRQLLWHMAGDFGVTEEQTSPHLVIPKS